MTSRRDFLRRTSLALAGGLLVGDAALELYERLTHRRVFAGGLPRLVDLNLTTNFRAGMFSVYVRPDDRRFDGIGKVTIDGGPATVEHGLVNGWYRVSRYLGEGKLEAKNVMLLAGGMWKLRGAQVEEGRFPTSHIPTRHTPATRKADHVVFNMHYPPPSMHDYIHGGRPDAVALDRNRSTPPRYTPDGLLLVEGTRTNYALHSEAPR